MFLFVYFGLIMHMNIFSLVYLHFLMIMALFISLLVPTLLSKIKLPSVRCVTYWRSSVLSPFIYLVNRLPSTILGGQVPRQVLFPNRPIYSLSPRVFGCTCYVFALDPGLAKLYLQAIKCVSLRYSRTQKGYKCYSLLFVVTLFLLVLPLMRHCPTFLLPYSLLILVTIFLHVFR